MPHRGFHRVLQAILLVGLITAWRAALAAESPAAVAATEIADQDETRVACESRTPASVSIVVQGTQDDPQPFPKLPSVVAFEGGRLWITWVEDSTHVGWSEYRGAGVWSAPRYESFESSSIESARATIRAIVLKE
jgi:hypothetical protein